MAGPGCSAVLLFAAVMLVIAGALAYRHGPRWLQVILHHPPGVVIHHSATGAIARARKVDAEFIDATHQRRGWGISDGDREFHIGYHYVILPDGTVQEGRPEWLPGAHAVGANDHLGICLIGNFSSKDNPNSAEQPARPTEAQMSALKALLRELMGKYHFGPDDIHGHRDFAATDCPGDRFPMEALRANLRQQTGN
jgi:N-acetyl-anhydromuramyl-L-alanine amidase AmpD